MNIDERITGPEKYMVPVKTRNVMVDLMGGEEIPLPRADKMRHHLPSEMLLMNEHGEFVIQNDMEDQTMFRLMALQPDDTNEVGRRKRPRKSSNRQRGGFGGGGGDDGEGDF